MEIFWTNVWKKGQIGRALEDKIAILTNKKNSGEIIHNKFFERLEKWTNSRKKFELNKWSGKMDKFKDKIEDKIEILTNKS